MTKPPDSRPQAGVPGARLAGLVAMARRLGKNSRVRDAGEGTIPRMTTTNRTYKSGQSRDQASFLPPCLEDYVGRDNPVRAIDAYVDSLDLSGLGFGDVGSDGGAGQPPYDPADLLKLYLYGYLHQVRSSRRLEREARRNVELMWLLRGLAPGYRTIANFRKDNAAGLTAANRDFVVLARSLDLLAALICWAARWWRSMARSSTAMPARPVF